MAANRQGRRLPDWWGIADPYLRWAHQTDFRHFECDDERRFGILAKMPGGLSQKKREQFQAADVVVAHPYVGRKYFTASVSVDGRMPQLELLYQAGVRRMELATPVAMQRQFDAGLPMNRKPGPATFLGFIDDGCPFAHADLRYSTATGERSRIQFIWDQNGRPTASTFGYGRILRSDDLAGFLKAGTPLVGPDGTPCSPDEDAVYGLAGFPGMRRLASHGAHVLGLAAGKLPVAARISPSRWDERDSTRPPDWAEPDIRPEAALCFVQIPRKSLDDSSGRWLGRNVLDGIHMICREALKSKDLESVTINISYGPQTGPHDGSSLLEEAIDDLVASTKLFQLQVVVPVGNSYQSRAHANFSLADGGGAVTWFVSPDSETPAFLEIWLPRGVTPAQADVMIAAPNGISLRAAATDDIACAPDDSWHVVSSNAAATSEESRWGILVALRTTGGYEKLPRPPHGRWKVSVRAKPGKLSGIAHAYLSRSDYNFGGLQRGRPGYLWDPTYDPDSYLRHREYDRATSSPKPAARVRSKGSISGLATGTKTFVAGGYRIDDQEPAPYSSSGPSRGTRFGPDWTYPTDESRSLPGLIAWGNRSGAAVRLVGTSAAAPQYARELVEKRVDLGLPEPGDVRLGNGRRR